MSRAKKSGVAYDIEKKMEENYDREDSAGTPARIVEWFNDVMKNEPGFKPCPSGDWKQICTFFHDGIELCKFINVILKSTGKQTVGFNKKASPFTAMTNIENFNNGCGTFGLSKECFFQSGDLYEIRKGPFYNVINCLHMLGMHANEQQFKPQYSGGLVKTVNRD